MILLDTAPAAGASISLWQLSLDGGWIMIILALLLVISIYVFIARARLKAPKNFAATATPRTRAWYSRASPALAVP